MHNCDDIETICLLRFGNKSKANMKTVMDFLTLRGDLVWTSSERIARAIIESVK